MEACFFHSDGGFGVAGEGLPDEAGAEVFGHLRRLHEEQRTTVLVVTHDQRYITPSDSVLRLQDGTLADGV